MVSRALIPMLNVLDFCVLKEQPTIKFVFAKFFWQPLYDAVVCSNFVQIRETDFTSRVPLLEKS
jgi:hypothetical protein